MKYLLQFFLFEKLAFLYSEINGIVANVKNHSITVLRVILK